MKRERHPGRSRCAECGHRAWSHHFKTGCEARPVIRRERQWWRRLLRLPAVVERTRCPCLLDCIEVTRHLHRTSRSSRP